MLRRSANITTSNTEHGRTSTGRHPTFTQPTQRLTLSFLQSSYNCHSLQQWKYNYICNYLFLYFRYTVWYSSIQFCVPPCSLISIAFGPLEIAAVAVNPKSSSWTWVTLQQLHHPQEWLGVSTVTVFFHVTQFFGCASQPYMQADLTKSWKNPQAPKPFPSSDAANGHFCGPRSSNQEKGKLCVSWARSTVAKISWLKTWLLHSSVRHFSCYYY